MKLYPFQREMVDRFVDVPAVLCGDDMGLGKTFEALALDLRRRTTKLAGKRQYHYKTLIVCPLSVVSSWQAHIAMIWPQARVAVIDPKNRQTLIDALQKPYHYYIVHWEGVRLISELRSIDWYHVVADEVHRAKNRKAQQTQALKKLRTSYRTGLSGTPADNNPQDLWSVLNWLYPKVWTSYWSFERYFVKVQRHTTGTCTAADCYDYHKHGFTKVVGVANVEELHDNMKDYYMRRTKQEVIKDLPEKYYTQIEVDLIPRQRRIYEEMKRDMLAWIGKHEEEPIAAPVVIAQLVRLQQFALAYAELETVTRMKDGERVAVQRVKLSEPSSKIDALCDIIEDNPEQQIVVFSQSKQAIRLVKARMDRMKVSCIEFTGDTTPEDRTQAVKDFQAGNVRVFAGTIAAGGEGITLTAASIVVFLDRAWNPSRNRQAEDRLHRIGQKNAVQVIDIVAKDTVDAGRLQHINLKWSWLKELLGDKQASASLLPS